MPYPNPSDEHVMKSLNNLGYFHRNILSEVQKNALRDASNKKISQEAKQARIHRHAIEDRLLAKEFGITLEELH